MRPARITSDCAVNSSVSCDTFESAEPKRAEINSAPNYDDVTNYQSWMKNSIKHGFFFALIQVGRKACGWGVGSRWCRAGEPELAPGAGKGLLRRHRAGLCSAPWLGALPSCSNLGLFTSVASKTEARKLIPKVTPSFTWWLANRIIHRTQICGCCPCCARTNPRQRLPCSAHVLGRGVPGSVHPSRPTNLSPWQGASPCLGSKQSLEHLSSLC